MNRTLMAVAIGFASLTTGAAAALAADGPALRLAEPGPLALDTAAAYAQPADDKPAAAPEAPAQFGLPGRWWITLGAGVAHDLSEDTDYNAHVAFSTFLAKELEFSLELGAWYFAQDGTDTGGVNPSMIFRWHFLHDEQFDWTLYGDVGIGLLFAFDDVPDGGTSIDFTPRAGVGFTHRLGESDARFQVGLRYHHISNGRVQGDAQNPSRDSIMIYFGIVFPL